MVYATYINHNTNNVIENKRKNVLTKKNCRESLYLFYTNHEGGVTIHLLILFIHLLIFLIQHYLQLIFLIQQYLQLI